MDEVDYTKLPWRVGRKVGRTVYAQLNEADEDGVLIGMFDTPELAQNAVEAHNASL